ncbi:MAG: Fic family protein [Bacteroidota bacterium]
MNRINLEMNEVVRLLQEYQNIQFKKILHYEKYNHYEITHHSTNIEGSTLTETETQLLLDEGLTPKGKPLTHSLMTKDHYEALLYIIQEAKQKREVTVEFIQSINAKVLKNTGAIYNTLFGEIDSSKGAFRKANVRAGSRYFVNYAKVPEYTAQFTDELAKKMNTQQTIQDQLLLSFDAHLELVSIHPFYDGNGRTSRLLMNYLQAYYNLPLAIVFTEDKADYFDTLEQTRKEENRQFFYDFMLQQYTKHLQTEIQRYREIL